MEGVQGCCTPRHAMHITSHHHTRRGTAQQERRQGDERLNARTVTHNAQGGRVTTRAHAFSVPNGRSITLQPLHARCSCQAEHPNTTKWSTSRVCPKPPWETHTGTHTQYMPDTAHIRHTLHTQVTRKSHSRKTQRTQKRKQLMLTWRKNALHAGCADPFGLVQLARRS